MKKLALKLARTWWARQALKVTAAVSTAATVALSKIQLTTDGTVIDPLNADNEAAIAAGAAALVVGGIEMALSWLAAKDSQEAREGYTDITPNTFR